MLPVLEDVTGGYWHAVWALTGQICPRVLRVKGSLSHVLAGESSVDTQGPTFECVKGGMQIVTV